MKYIKMRMLSISQGRIDRVVHKIGDLVCLGENNNNCMEELLLYCLSRSNEVEAGQKSA